MSDIVVIPTHERPEYLWVCLEKLKAAEGIDSKQIFICEDNHADKPKGFTTQIEILATIREAEKMFGRERVTYLAVQPHNYYGNSYNLTEGLRTALNTNVGYVYLVEDDTMVMPDFFRWHEAVQKQFDPFVSCASRYNRSLNFQINGAKAIDETIKDPNACVRSDEAYASWAVCFQRENLYYLLKHVDHHDWQPGYEQDIFTQTFMGDGRSKSIWPYIPRAYHMGWYSYHRTAGMKFNGTLEEKVTALRRALYDNAKIKDMAGLQDIDPLPKNAVQWEGPLYIRSDFK